MNWWLVYYQASSLETRTACIPIIAWFAFVNIEFETAKFERRCAMADKRTSAKAAKAASSVLRSKSASKTAKTAAASALAQAPQCHRKR